VAAYIDSRFPGSGKTFTASYLVGKLISSSPPGTKILVTAPGHKALDSICRALMAGIPSSTGENFVPNIVRLGDREVMAESVWPRSLGALVETRLFHAEAELNALITDAANICDKLGALRRQMVQLGDSNPRHHDLVRDCATLEKQHQEALSEVKKSKLSLQRRKRAVVQEEIAVLADPSVDVVCSTLASCAKKALRNVGFHTLIVDDAARASELDTLIALGLGSRRVVLVGDRNLLPPPIFSSNCQVKGYDKSLFHRLAPSHHVPYLEYVDRSFAYTPLVACR
jgi:senataxin